MCLVVLYGLITFDYSRGAVDESGEQFVAYFLPTEETLGKRKRDEEDNADYVPEDEYVLIHSCLENLKANIVEAMFKCLPIHVARNILLMALDLGPYSFFDVIFLKIIKLF